MKKDLFITNADTKKLRDRLKEIISASEELKFLVGFFYFSGISELYDALKKKKNTTLKVLVGLSVDKLNGQIIEYGDEDSGAHDAERADKFIESLVKPLTSRKLDEKSFYEQIRFFINLIKEDKLIIRKTRNPNHAKLYFFKLNESQVNKSVFVTGSSNLTSAGLGDQEEFNVEISDYGNQEAEEYFDSLWDDAVKITEYQEFKEKLIKLLETKTMASEVSPFESFALILKVYLDQIGQKNISKETIEISEKAGYKTYCYQIDAVKQALKIIEENNGVIISDVVGLGKSVIASMVARELCGRGVIISPPGLMGDENGKSGWEKYKRHFRLDGWEVRSLGKLDSILEFVRENPSYETIIIDEAHRFRNEDTEAFESLSNICRGRKVILITATPFNNSPKDILSLLSLFIPTGKSIITLDDNLDIKFRIFEKEFEKLAFIKKHKNSSDKNKRDKALVYYKSIFEEDKIDDKKISQRSRYLSGQIRSVIEPVTIRRNRLDLKKDKIYSKEISQLSEVRDPKEGFYELTPEQSEFYDTVINKYFGEDGQFKGAIYRPYFYETGNETDTIESDNGKKENHEKLMQKNLFDFMRRLIVKRFESSFGSFRDSLIRFSHITGKALEFIENSNGLFILDRKLMEDIYQDDMDSIANRLTEYEEMLSSGNFPKSNKVYKIKDFKLQKEFINDIKADKELLLKITKEVETLGLIHNDPKAAKLIETLRSEIKASDGEPRRKVVIFSEYSDTVSYLEPIIEKAFPGKILVVKGGLSDSKIKSIVENFDASYKKSEQADSYDILLSTDKISEGFNLNRAGTIINYDIPWNPTRVIQRVGRINRIAKKVFNDLYIYNFFPTVKGSNIIKSREIAQHKMFLIHNTLGEDSKIFEIDEEPTPANLFTRINENPDNLEEESFQTKIRQKYYDLCEKYPEVLQRILTLPPRVKTSKEFTQNNQLIFIKKGSGLFVKFIDYKDGSPLEITFEEAYQLIECEKAQKRLDLSNKFWDNYLLLREHKEKFTNVINAQSLEQKAFNSLKELQRANIMELSDYNKFIRDLMEDITEYKTLRDYTLRGIVNINPTPKNDKDVSDVKQMLDGLIGKIGIDFLEKEKQRVKSLFSEIIIAVENSTNGN